MEEFKRQEAPEGTVQDEGESLDAALESGLEQEREAQDICIICGRSGRDGIRVISEFICEECETEIVRTDVQDAKYPFFIHRLKRIWYSKNA